MHFDVVSKAQQFRPLFNKKRPARQQQPVFSTLNAFFSWQDEKIAIAYGNFQRLGQFATTILARQRLWRVGNTVIGNKQQRRAIERIFCISF